ncbi:recombinase family protein [Priestia aryabhattai]|uniref:recombinase family protein n=1 Tax=Priestia aryabhattai TaxID=412384 RepID=UPI00159BCFC4|nr:recombinase family protein [Priestia aryabhattai]
MPKKVFFYIRVSSKDQNVDRQVIEAKKLGIDERDIFIDKESGKNFNRPQYQAMKAQLRESDLLYIHSIDRFGRNAREMKKEWDELTQEKKIDIKVLDMPLLDTTQHKDTLGTFVSDLVLQVLSFMAERERENTRIRQREGIAAAKAAGKHLGRPIISLGTLSTYQKKIIKENYEAWKSKKITAVAFARLLDLKRNTFYRIMKEYEETL